MNQIAEVYLYMFQQVDGQVVLSRINIHGVVELSKYVMGALRWTTLTLKKDLDGCKGKQEHNRCFLPSPLGYGPKLGNGNIIYGDVEKVSKPFFLSMDY